MLQENEKQEKLTVKRRTPSYKQFKKYYNEDCNVSRRAFTIKNW